MPERRRRDLVHRGSGHGEYGDARHCQRHDGRIHHLGVLPPLAEQRRLLRVGDGVLAPLVRTVVQPCGLDERQGREEERVCAECQIRLGDLGEVPVVPVLVLPARCRGEVGAEGPDAEAEEADGVDGDEVGRDAERADVSWASGAAGRG